MSLDCAPESTALIEVPDVETISVEKSNLVFFETLCDAEANVAQSREVILVEPSVRDVVIEVHEIERVFESPGRGPRGPAGSGTSDAYVHNQISATEIWSVAHNLGFKPAVELVDSSGNEYDAEIIHLSTNLCMVYHDEATAGTARCN